ncbi:hypothetical protein BASA61_008883 [Batrachochytrium salamandrivorans]|nr:hypothetical protein BASA61_008883 [Batrachochytrium salamandrivorans]
MYSAKPTQIACRLTASTISASTWSRGFKPPHGKVYSLTPKETLAMSSYVQEQLSKKFIRPSISPAAAPCFFVAKKDGELRPVQDYRALNSGTIKKRYPPSTHSGPPKGLIQRKGLFEQQVMSFGFANAPPHFQWVMNSILRDMIGKYVLVYLDDIIIYSEDEAAHLRHVRSVLQRLREKNLYCKMEKCFYGKKKLHYLGYVISPAGIEMDQTKIASVQNWPTPGKESFRDNVVLTHADETKEFLVEVDASDFAVAGVLSQYDVQKQLRPVAFFSRQMVPAERNYEIYDKELLAVTVCLKEWRHFLQNSVHPFTILTDHKNLEFFMTSKQLTRRQARWSELLSEFTFRLSYRPGSHNGKADHLSRRPDYKVTEEKANFLQLLQPSMVVAPLDAPPRYSAPR